MDLIAVPVEMSNRTVLCKRLCGLEVTIVTQVVEYEVALCVE